MPLTRAQERRAEREVLAAVERALADMRDYVLRELAAGREPDKRSLSTLLRGVQGIADEYAIDLTRGKFGEFVKDAMKEAGKDFAAESGVAVVVTRKQVEGALFSSYQHIKGILAAGERVVAEEMLASIVGGKSKRDVAKALVDRLRVQDAAGELGAVPAHRAEMIARNELLSNYRSTNLRNAEAAEFTHFKMIGPVDDRTEEICSRYVDEIHTAEEWQAIADKEGSDPNYPLLQWGFHVNCRHHWVGVEAPEAQQ